MNTYYAEIRLEADSAEAVRCLLADIKVRIDILEIRRQAPTLESATDDQLREEIHRRNTQHLARTLSRNMREECVIAMNEKTL